MSPRTHPRLTDDPAKPFASEVSPDFDLPKLQRNTLNEEVYQALKQALMTGRIAPGSTMTIRALAASFGVSLMPVREALRRLVAEHVLVLLPNRSVALPVLTRERFREITRIRTSLEGLATAEATALLSREDIKRLETLNAAMEGPEGSTSPEYLIHNREFHFTIYRGARMPTLLAIIESLWVQIGPFLTIQQHAHSSLEIPTMVHHRRALQAFRKRNADQARAAIVADIEDAAQIISAQL